MSKSLSKITCAKPNSWLHSSNLLYFTVFPNSDQQQLYTSNLLVQKILESSDFSFIPQIQFISNPCSHRVWIISKIWPILTVSCYYPGPRHYFLSFGLPQQLISNMVSLLICLSYSHSLFHTERPEWIFTKESNHYLSVKGEKAIWSYQLM